MKFQSKILLIVLIALLAAIVPVEAQTVIVSNSVAPLASDTPPPQFNAGGISLSGTSAELAKAGKDLWSQFLLMKPFTTNGNATARFFGGMNLSSHDPIFGVMATVPISDNFALGAIVAYKGGQFYEGGANLSFGVTNNWPVVGMVKSFAGDGIVYNFKTREPANYAFAGFEKEWYVSSRWDIGIGVVTANTSDASGVDIIGGIHATYWWKHRKS